MKLMLMRLAPVFVTFVLFAVSSRAQDPPPLPVSPVDAQSMLESSDPRVQAWGAWYAGRLLFKDCAPRLERLVEGNLEMTGWPQLAVLDIALDALIELEAGPAPELLLKIHPQRPVQALILLGRLGADGEGALLKLLNEAQGYSWFAAANLLHRRKARGFAALVLRDLELTARIVVSEDGKHGTGSGGGSGGAGDGGQGFAPGYPPWAHYAPRTSAAPGVAVLAAGPTTVYYERVVAPAGQSPAGSGHILGNPAMEDRLAFFERLGPQLQADEMLSVAWRGERALKAETDQFVGGIRTKYQQFIAALTDSEWLTADEAAALSEPRIRIEMVDLRKK
jgi:hypothetical protein